MAGQWCRYSEEQALDIRLKPFWSGKDGVRLGLGDEATPHPIPLPSQGRGGWGRYRAERCLPHYRMERWQVFWLTIDRLAGITSTEGSGDAVWEGWSDYLRVVPKLSLGGIWRSQVQLGNEGEGYPRNEPGNRLCCSLIKNFFLELKINYLLSEKLCAMVQ
jgi:hypothetical protein